MNDPFSVGDLVKVARGQYAENDIIGVIIEIMPGPPGSARYRVWTTGGHRAHDVGPLFDHEMRRMVNSAEERT